MILAAHQPDLLPYTGFWHKMLMADVFDIAVWDQFQKRGYQKRVRMRDAWVTVPASGGEVPIRDVQTDPDLYRKRLFDAVIGKYQGAEFWADRGQMVCEWIDGCQSEWLWENNLHLIMEVKEWLGIRTPLGIASPLPLGPSGIADLVDQYGADGYLSGTGGRAYLTDDDVPVPVIWSSHQPVTGDSILTVLFDREDPMEVVAG